MPNRFDPEAVERAVAGAFIDIMDATGGYPVTRQEIIEAVQEGVRLAFVEALAPLGDRLHAGLGDDEKLLSALRKAGADGLTASAQYRQVFSNHRSRHQLAVIRQRLADGGLVRSASVVTEGSCKPTTVTWATEHAPPNT